MELARIRYADGQWSAPLPALDGEHALVLVFAAPSFGAAPGPLVELAAAYPRATLIGCSTAGEIDGPHLHDETLTGAVVRFEHSRVRAGRVPLRSAADSFACGVTLGAQLAAPDLRGVVVFARGHDVNGSGLIRGLATVLPPEVVITGGLAGDGDRFGSTFVIAGGELLPDAAVAVGLYGDRVRIGHGTQGGWDTFGPERVVTRSEGNVVYELDGRPALALYKEYLGERAAELPRSALLFPLQVRAHRDTSHSVVRSVLAVDEAAQALIFVGDVPTGSYGKLMRANFDRLILGAQRAAEDMTAPAAGPRLNLAISCVGRRLVLGERTEEELEVVLEALPPGTEQVGFYSYGEIAPHATGRCDLHNQTMTLTLISEA